MTTQVAEAILAQLGGRRFIAMTGAQCFIGSPRALSFQLPGSMCRSRINAVRITLESNDTYTVKFFRVPRSSCALKTIAECVDIYADHLRDVFTRETGLETSMGRVRVAS